MMFRVVVASVLALSCIPSASLGQSAEQIGAFFETARKDLPCLSNADRIAKGFQFGLSSKPSNDPTYTYWDYVNKSGDVFIGFSKDGENEKPQHAVSVSVYQASEEFPAELTLWFAEHWHLPDPTPLRRNHDIAEMGSTVRFPNGPMNVVISYNPATGLTQIFASTLELTRRQLRVC